MVKVSVIMPVYNCETYLEKSIGSVIAQTLQEWELLCIDDGSTDRSLKILEQYREQDARIRVFSQRNQGAGMARNLGLEQAEGEFVGFLDADDFFLEEDALSCMYRACKERKVRACGSAFSLFKGGEVYADQTFEKLGQINTEGTVMQYIDFQFDYGYYCFLYDRQTLRNAGIIFPPYRRFQDPPFFVRAMYEIGRFCYVDKALYCYRVPEVSARFSPSKLEGLLRGLYDNLVFAREKGLHILFERTLRRLDEEYGEIICHHMADAGSLRILLQINDFVRETGRPDYMAEPLRAIFDSIGEADRYRVREFRDRLYQSGKIYLYGAGNRASALLACLKREKLSDKVAAILVSDRKNNPKQMEGIWVKPLDEYVWEEGDMVVIAVSGMYRKEVAENLQARGITSYIQLPEGYNGE